MVCYIIVVFYHAAVFPNSFVFSEVNGMFWSTNNQIRAIDHFVFHEGRNFKHSLGAPKYFSFHKDNWLRNEGPNVFNIWGECQQALDMSL